MKEFCSESEKRVCVKISKLAIASLILAFASFSLMLYLPRFLPRDRCVLYRIVDTYAVLATSILSIFIGILAILRIKKNKTAIRGNELVVMAIVLSLWGSHEAVMLPRVRRVSYNMLCAKQMKNLGKAILIYSSDNNDKFPSASNWCDLLIKHADITEEQFMCGDSFWPIFSYGFNKNISNVHINDVPPDTVVLFEIEGGRNVSGGAELMNIDKHGSSSNVLFVNFHVLVVQQNEADDLKWEVPAKSNEK